MGERSPHNDPNAKGGVYRYVDGYNKNGNDAGCFGRSCFSTERFSGGCKSMGIKIDRAKICGGGAKSELWRKIIANVLNIEIDVPSD